MLQTTACWRVPSVDCGGIAYASGDAAPTMSTSIRLWSCNATHQRDELTVRSHASPYLTNLPTLHSN